MTTKTNKARQPGASLASVLNVVERFSGAKAQDVQRWFDNYDRAADFVSWDDAKRGAALPLVLTGEAAAHFHGLSTAVQESYADARAALIQAFAETSEPLLLHDQLTERKMRPGEGIKAYARAIRQLCHRVNPDMADADMVAHFLRGLPRELRAYLTLAVTREQLPTMDTVVQLACRVEAIGGEPAPLRVGTAPVLAAVTDDVTALTAAIDRPAPQSDRLKLVEERLAQLIDVIAAQTVARANKSEPPKDLSRCHFCGRLGHVQRDCWHRARESEGSAHHSRRPPNRSFRDSRDRSPDRSPDRYDNRDRNRDKSKESARRRDEKRAASDKPQPKNF